jgi:hypothetical protein
MVRLICANLDFFFSPYVRPRLCHTGPCPAHILEMACICVRGYDAWAHACPFNVAAQEKIVERIRPQGLFLFFSSPRRVPPSHNCTYSHPQMGSGKYPWTRFRDSTENGKRMGSDRVTPQRSPAWSLHDCPIRQEPLHGLGLNN